MKLVDTFMHNNHTLDWPGDETLPPFALDSALGYDEMVVLFFADDSEEENDGTDT